MNARKLKPFTVEGIDINLYDRDEALAEIRAAQGGESYAFYTMNLDHCIKLRNVSAFRHAYRQARFVTADGAPIAWLARLLGVKLSRVTGADLVDPLCALAAGIGLRVFFYGTTHEILVQTTEQLRSRYPELNIVGCMAPGLNFTHDGPEATAAIDAIRASRADLCLIALGAPKQELFAAHAVTLTQGCGFVCIGAALDFIAGAQVRAPIIFQKLGMEWIWRLGTNPVRMWRRYAGCAGLMGLYMLQVVPRRLRSRTHIGPSV